MRYRLVIDAGTSFVKASYHGQQADLTNASQREQTYQIMLSDACRLASSNEADSIKYHYMRKTHTLGDYRFP